jgi:hypothetical protein
VSIFLELGDLGRLVPNDALYDRFTELTRGDNSSWSAYELARHVAGLIGWGACRDGAKGVLVILGVESDSHGNRRTLLKAYRAAQIAAALDLDPRRLLSPEPLHVVA